MTTYGFSATGSAKASYAAALQAKLAHPSTASANEAAATFGGGSHPSKVDALKAANTALYEMANLSRTVKSLAANAEYLRDEQATGLEKLRTQTQDALAAFSKIGHNTSAEAAPDLSKMSARELQATLGDMQKELRTNMRKLGASSMAASGSLSPNAGTTTDNATWFNTLLQLRTRS